MRCREYFAFVGHARIEAFSVVRIEESSFGRDIVAADTGEFDIFPRAAGFFDADREGPFAKMHRDIKKFVTDLFHGSFDRGTKKAWEKSSSACGEPRFRHVEKKCEHRYFFYYFNVLTNHSSWAYFNVDDVVKLKACFKLSRSLTILSLTPNFFKMVSPMLAICC